MNARFAFTYNCRIQGTVIHQYWKFIDDISGATDGKYLWAKKTPKGKVRRVPSEAVQEGLEYASEDIEALNNYVLITPYEIDEDGDPFLPEHLGKVYDLHRSGVY